MDVLQKRQTLRFTIESSAEDTRLDRYLAATGAGLSRGAARTLIDLGGVHVNGRRVRKCSLVVSATDRVEVNIDGLPTEIFTLKEEHIIYRDKYLVVINKPAGVDSQPTPSRYKGTLYAALTGFLQNPKRPDLRPSIGMVQRLDRDTSGLIAFSVHQAAHKEMTRAFQQRRVVKKYQALVAGRMSEIQGEFCSQLARRRATNTMKSVARGGQEAITRYRRLDANEDVSYVEVEIPTGRSHQIRAHFSEAGHPLLGDLRYAGPKQLDGVAIDRQMLHANQLQLLHPRSGEKLDFVAELPYDMQRVVTHFFRDDE